MSFRSVASIVYARIFRLIDNKGNTIAQLDTKPSLQMNHLDPAEYLNSRIQWTTGAPAAQQSTQMIGPGTLAGSVGALVLNAVVATKGVISEILSLNLAQTSSAVVATQYIESTDVPSVQVTTSGGTSSQINISSSGTVFLTANAGMSITSNGAANNMFLTSAGQIVEQAASSQTIQPATSLNLNPGTSMQLNGRIARMLMPSYLATGGDTGNVTVNTDTATIGPIALLAGDIVLVTAQSWMICTTNQPFGGIVIMENGVAKTRGNIIFNTAGAGLTIPVETYSIIIPSSGNYTYKLQVQPQVGGNYRSVSSTINVLVFSTK